MSDWWNRIKEFFKRFRITSDGNMTNRALSGESSTPLPRNGVGDEVNSLLGFDGSQDGSGISSVFGALKSWLYSMTGEHMTNADLERNAMQMQNQEDIYQRQVSGMQKAGLNPALMYQSGASSAPSAPAPTQPGLNMSDIMQALLLDKQGRLLESQIKNTDAKTDRESQETERLKLINKYYPQVTETQLDKMLIEMGLDEASTQKIKNEADLVEVEKRLKTAQSIIAEAEADESSAYYKARREYEEAKDDESKARAAEFGIRAAAEQLEKDYMDKYSMKMGSNDYIALAACLAGLFNVDIEKAVDDAKEGTQNWLSRLRSKMNPAYNNHNSHGGRHD